MMKLECSQTSRIATEATASTGLTNEYLLDLSPPPYDCVLPAPSASKVTSRFADMPSLAVMRAKQHDMGQPGFTRLLSPLSRAPADASARSQSVLCQPVAQRRLAATKRLGDQRDRHASLDKGFELVPREATPRGMVRAVRRFEPVLLDPVADRRFVQVKSPAYLGEREAMAQKLLQRCAIHSPYCLRRLGGNPLETRHFSSTFVPILCLRASAQAQRAGSSNAAVITGPCAAGSHTAGSPTPTSPPCHRARARRRGRTRA